MKARLEAAREAQLAARSQYEEEIAQAVADIKAGDTPEAFATRLGDWYQAVSDGLREGKVTLDRSGRLRDAPPRPKRDSPAGRYAAWKLDDLERELVRYEQRRKESVKPIETAIELLDMDSRDEVEIDAADYHSMLASR